MNPLFWAILLVIATAASVQTWMRRRRTNPDRRTLSEEPLFSPEDFDWPLDYGDWQLEGVEFLAAPDRVRAVATIAIDEDRPDHRRRAIEILAREIYRHTQVDAVLVEANGTGAEPDLYLFAPDGRGWWGRELIGTVLGGPSFPSSEDDSATGS